jgi:hypothetical protein
MLHAVLDVCDASADIVLVPGLVKVLGHGAELSPWRRKAIS